MIFAAVESNLEFLFLALPAEARSAMIWSSVFLCYSCLTALTEAALRGGLGCHIHWCRSGSKFENGSSLREAIHPQERRLRRMVMNDAATARRLMALEVTLRAPSWAAAAEWAADRLVWERC